MREYRGKRLDDGEWVHGSLINDRYIVGDVIEWNDEYFNTEWWMAVDPSTVGQYTGLHDDTEDQNEIFDGDIAKFEYEGHVYICKIVYSAGGYMFISDSLPDSHLFLSELASYDREYGWVEYTEKLGNIHDNPELLEVTV